MRTFLAAVTLLAAPLWAGDTALTIYNQNFGVVRGTVSLDLQKGENDIRIQEVTSQLEPDSVILRDPSGKRPLQILEQGYRNDPVTQGLLLSLFEGKTIDFLRDARDPNTVVKGKIIRSGYTAPPPPPVPGRYYAPPQSNQTEPIIEVDGTLRFGLPGLPVFPSLGDDTILKPELSWKLNATEAGKLEAELAYITGGMSWEADYNIVANAGDTLDLVGWVTMTNNSGKTFTDARVKLMAGDVNKVTPEMEGYAVAAGRMMAKQEMAGAPVTEKAFDEYHLYTLGRLLTLRNGETKQVEFVRAAGIKSQKIYVYDGLSIDWNRWRGYPRTEMRRNEEMGAESDTKVAVMREFKNSEANKLGIPLPAGRLRFYQQDEDQQLEFIGENKIDHTPKDETIRVVTGNAFDLVGERRRTDFKVDNSANWAEEAFEIKLRNHKKEEVEIRVVEHLFRWVNWEITEKTNTYLKLNAQEIEFRVQLKPDEEKVLTYRVKYSW